MRRCFSVLTTSRQAGEWCSPFLTSGATILREIFPTMSRAEAVPLRLTSFWRMTAAPGGLLIEPAHPGGPDGTREDLVGAGGRGRHSRHGGEDIDGARAQGGRFTEKCRDTLRHHERRAAAGHGHAVRCARS